jgi:hypothetical protein
MVKVHWYIYCDSALQNGVLPVVKGEGSLVSHTVVLALYSVTHLKYRYLYVKVHLIFKTDNGWFAIH